MWRMDLGGALRKVRTDAGMSQAELGRVLECDQTRVSRLENNIAVNTITFDEAWAVEVACGVPIGTIARLAGYVSDGDGVLAALDADVSLSVYDRHALKTAYNTITDRNTAESPKRRYVRRL